MRIYLFIFFIFLFNLCFCSPLIYKILHYNSLLPLDLELRQRVITSICCQDCEYLPKVENAGHLIDENGTKYQIMHNGLKILENCYYGSWMTTLIKYLKGHHEPQEEKCFHEVLKYIPENSVMIELGAYWGYYSMWFQKKIKGAKNYLVEPDFNNLLIGKKNFELNNLIGQFTNALVGSENLHSQTFIDWNKQEHKVKQISIDQFALDNNIEFIYLLHSDIQGAEIDMLKGCKKLTESKKIGYYFISTHRGTHKECLKILQEANLEILVSHTRKESFSADGLIIAKLLQIPGPEKLEISRRSNKFYKLIEEIVETKK